VSIKIEGSGRLRGSPVQKGGRGATSQPGSFARQMTTETSGPASVAATNALSGIDGLLALQEVDDASARASRGKRRASDLLDKLDEIRHGLLSGNVPSGKLVELAKLVQSRRTAVDDPHLAEILDEVDLRAQVELAKLTPGPA